MVHRLVAGVLVAIVVQTGRVKFVQDWMVTRKNGVVMSVKVIELVGVREMLVNKGAFGVGKVPTTPSKVTPALKASARPSTALLVSMVTA